MALSKNTWILSTAAIALLAGCSNGGSHASSGIAQRSSADYVTITRPITKDPLITIPPGALLSYPFDIDTERMLSVRLIGKFTAHGGQGNDIQVFVTDADGLENIRNGHPPATAVFSTNKVTVGQSDSASFVHSGRYFLIFNNRFSLFTKKYVQNGLELQYSQLRPQ
jgi:hypothetical protein